MKAYTPLFEIQLTADGNDTYYGNYGAGIVIICNDKILLGLRSSEVNESGTWSYMGGKIDIDNPSDNDFKKEAIREVEEEANITLEMKKVKPLCVFKDNKNNFTYKSFYTKIDNEIKINPNWEHDEFEWFDIDSLPANLHPGMKYALPYIKQIILNKKKTEQLIEKMTIESWKILKNSKVKTENWSKYLWKWKIGLNTKPAHNTC